MMEDLTEFVAERNKAVGGTFEEFLAYSSKQGVKFSRSEVAEISYHKCRTAITSLPTSVREASHSWLLSRGYQSWA